MKKLTNSIINISLKDLVKKKGDKIFLIRNFNIKQLNKKLNIKKIRLFKITKKVLTLNYKLDLLKIIRLKIKVFYISLFKLIL